METDDNLLPPMHNPANDSLARMLNWVGLLGAIAMLGLAVFAAID